MSKAIDLTGAGIKEKLILLIPSLAVYTSTRKISNLIEMLPDSDQCPVNLGHQFAADSIS